jgi:hypothetical protein
VIHRTNIVGARFSSRETNLKCDLCGDEDVVPRSLQGVIIGVSAPLVFSIVGKREKPVSVRLQCLGYGSPTVVSVSHQGPELVGAVRRLRLARKCFFQTLVEFLPMRWIIYAKGSSGSG